VIFLAICSQSFSEEDFNVKYEQMRIKDGTFLITGGVSGLGEAVARQLVAKGANVVLLDINDERGAKLVGELGSKSIFVNTDVTSEASVINAVNKSVEKFGDINGLINCAGVGYSRKVLNKGGVFPLELWTKVIQINLIGTFNVLRLVAQRMASQQPDESGERGVIINTASVAAFEGQQGQSAYSASKGGVVSMTLPLAREFAPLGIRVMTIAPGVFSTPLFNLLPDSAQQQIINTVTIHIYAIHYVSMLSI
jgi:3-hydroxyacyl-CoA dehydrogenase/3-hydroxy-2-methylbutyryl-CoA dehydrogenase